MKAIEIDIKKWVIMLLPTFLRGRCMVAFLQVLAQPLISLYSRFLVCREEQIYELSHTGQTCLLRKVLNDYFGVDGFLIEDSAVEGEWVIVYDETDLLSEQHLIVSNEEPVLVYDEALLHIPVGSFVVYVPKEVCEDVVYDTAVMPLIKTIVEKYRLVSRKSMYKSK